MAKGRDVLMFFDNLNLESSAPMYGSSAASSDTREDNYHTGDVPTGPVTLKS